MTGDHLHLEAEVDDGRADWLTGQLISFNRAHAAAHAATDRRALPVHLWVAEDARRLATGNFQAPGFYLRLGYELYGTLEDCPPGETVFYFRKTLDG